MRLALIVSGLIFSSLVSAEPDDGQILARAMRLRAEREKVNKSQDSYKWMGAMVVEIEEQLAKIKTKYSGKAVDIVKNELATTRATLTIRGQWVPPEILAAKDKPKATPQASPPVVPDATHPGECDELSSALTGLLVKGRGQSSTQFFRKSPREFLVIADGAGYPIDLTNTSELPKKVAIKTERRTINVILDEDNYLDFHPADAYLAKVKKSLQLTPVKLKPEMLEATKKDYTARAADKVIQAIATQREVAQKLSAEWQSCQSLKPITSDCHYDPKAKKYLDPKACEHAEKTVSCMELNKKLERFPRVVSEGEAALRFMEKNCRKSMTEQTLAKIQTYLSTPRATTVESMIRSTN